MIINFKFYRSQGIVIMDDVVLLIGAALIGFLIFYPYIRHRRRRVRMNQHDIETLMGNNSYFNEEKSQ